MSQSISGKLQAALTEIDRCNSQDPNRITLDGQDQPKELLYSQRLAQRLWSLTLQPSEVLLLATRAQHICRWMSSRQSYPPGRSGYLKWRKNLQKFHTEKLSQIMQSVGYDPNTINQATDLILKKNFSQNPEGQILEGAACLVFLEYELAAFAAKTETEKTIAILRKTWTKMSPTAQAIARNLPLGKKEKSLLQFALETTPKVP